MADFHVDFIAYSQIRIIHSLTTPPVPVDFFFIKHTIYVGEEFYQGVAGAGVYANDLAVVNLVKLKHNLILHHEATVYILQQHGQACGHVGGASVDVDVHVGVALNHIGGVAFSDFVVDSDEELFRFFYINAGFSIDVDVNVVKFEVGQGNDGEEWHREALHPFLVQEVEDDGVFMLQHLLGVVPSRGCRMSLGIDTGREDVADEAAEGHLA